MKRIMMKPGQTLWQAMKENGITIERPCGGNGLCRGCEVYVDGIGKVRSCQFSEEGNYFVKTLKRQQFHAVMEQGRVVSEGLNYENSVTEESFNCGNPVAAVDIGTTTVALKVFYQGEVYNRSFVNPQRQYGADVMSRIQAANSGGLDEMQRILRERLLQELEGIIGDCAEQVKIVISANTTMQHIFRGLSCEGLGKSPFRPVTLALEKSEEIWNFLQDDISNRKDVSDRKNISSRKMEEIFFPGISAFIGADIVSGIYALDLMEEEKPVLLLDLGTNGEMALGCRNKLFVASAAAGPAFEGSRLAMKIHASGIMKVFHELIEKKGIDGYGTLADPYFEEGYPVEIQIQEAQMVKARTDRVRITQEDIREIQMAKAAIRAGIEILMRAYGIAPDEVKKVYLAGGMGYYLNPDDAVGIGLLPEEFLQGGKIQSVGNTSLRGAVRYLWEEEVVAKAKMQRITDMAKEIVLSNTTGFHELYLNYM